MVVSAGYGSFFVLLNQKTIPSMQVWTVCMSDLAFECQGCGNCCNRIRIQSHDMTLGLALLPGEEDLFNVYPGAVKPYMGLRRMRGKGYNIEVVCHQMVREPCPLYDKILKRCTRYEDRPMACREYPFSSDPSTHAIERHCTWVKSHDDIVFGETQVQMTPGQNTAMIRINSFFLSLHDRMQGEHFMLVMFDVANDTWAVLR